MDRIVSVFDDTDHGREKQRGVPAGLTVQQGVDYVLGRTDLSRKTASVNGRRASPSDMLPEGPCEITISPGKIDAGR